MEKTQITVKDKNGEVLFKNNIDTSNLLYVGEPMTFSFAKVYKVVFNVRGTIPMEMHRHIQKRKTTITSTVIKSENGELTEAMILDAAREKGVIDFETGETFGTIQEVMILSYLDITKDYINSKVGIDYEC